MKRTTYCVESLQSFGHNIRTNSLGLVQRISRGLLQAVFAMVMLLVWDYCLEASDVSRAPNAQEQSHDPVSQMVTYTQQGRYDDAVQLGLQLIQNQPNDEIVYQQIADVYLIRAQKDASQREQWVTNAVSYVEKALLLNSKDRDVAGVHLFQDARSYELAADLSVTRRCAYYEHARKLLESRVVLLHGDQLTLQGKTFPLAPLRRENDKILAGVNGKAANAGCK